MSKRPKKTKVATRKQGWLEAVFTQFRLARYLTLYTVAYLLIVGVGVWGFTEMRDQNRRLEQEQAERIAFDNRRQYDICLSGNESRKAIRDAFDSYTDALVAASRNSEEMQTPKEEAEQQRRIALFRSLIEEKLEPLGPRNCADLLHP